MDLDKYEKLSIDNQNLKKYLDLNRYSFALQFKMSNDLESFRKYYQKIDLKNLNNKQQFLLRQDRFFLRILLKIKALFENKGIRLSSFK